MKPNPKGKDFQNLNKDETFWERLLWFRFMKQCPLCHAELWEKGYPIDGIWQRYKCSDRKCGWNWK